MNAPDRDASTDTEGARERRREELAAAQRDFARRVGPDALRGDGAERGAAAAIAPRSLALYRGGLRFKRLAEVRALLPQTRARLGDAFDRAFLAFCETSEPLGFARHREDAIAFARTLPLAVARIERAYLLAARNVAGAWFALGSRGLVILVRLRPGARLRRFAFPFPFASAR